MKKKIIPVMMLIAFIAVFVKSLQLYDVSGQGFYLFLMFVSVCGIFGGVMGCFEGTAVSEWLYRMFIEGEEDDE